MSKNIGGAHRGHAAGDTDLEKQASQLASDVKYKVKQKMSGATKMNPAQVAQAYLAQLAKSPAPSAVKTLAKKKLSGGLKEEYDISSLVKESVKTALNKVFVEGISEKIEEDDEELIFEGEEDRKYKVRVTDKKTGNTYVRMATRAKISELRSNPNISSVEMTEYGNPSRGESEKGETTSKVKSGKDWDGDGKVESGAKEYRGVVHNAIQRKKGGKADGKDTSKVHEEVITELKKGTDKNKITGKNVNNQKFIKINPTMEEVQTKNSSLDQKKIEASKKKEDQQNEKTRQQELNILQKKVAVLRSSPKGSDPSIMASYELEGEDIHEVSPPGFEGTVKAMKKYPELSKGKTPEGKEKNIYALAWYMKKKGYKSHRKSSGAMKEEACGSDETKVKKSEGGSEDPREISTKENLVKNKLRAMGLKMSYEPDGEVIGEEDYDRMKDRHLERGGMGARASQSPAKTGSSKPVDRKKHAETSKKAVDLVRANIQAKYGKGSLM